MQDLQIPGGCKMKMYLLPVLSLCVVLFATALASASGAGPGLTADEALGKLMDGNLRFLANRTTIRETSTPSIREALATGQKPFAIILACSDSRVPPEIIFDQGLGEIFVVRVAGNVPDPVILGSIEYAAEHFNCPLVVVLGHSRCGAVTAAVESQGHPHGNIGAIIKKIAPAVKQARKDVKSAGKSDLVESAIDNNIKLVAKSLPRQSPVIRSLVDAGKVKIIAAKYDLDDGKVRLLEE